MVLKTGDRRRKEAVRWWKTGGEPERRVDDVGWGGVEHRENEQGRAVVKSAGGEGGIIYPGAQVRVTCLSLSASVTPLMSL